MSSRRAFFESGLRKAGQTAVKAAEAHVTRRAARWIRPPFALDELEFLLACTRCGACIAACPHRVIFPLSARLGARVVGTPALDLLNKGCHLCAAWPCVAACEPGALKRPGAAPEEPALPRVAVAKVDTDTCLPYLGPECGACAESCPVLGAMCWKQSRPRIDPGQCVGCALCREACILEQKAIHVAARVQREHQSLAATIISKRD